MFIKYVNCICDKKIEIHVRYLCDLISLNVNNIIFQS